MQYSPLIALYAVCTLVLSLYWPAQYHGELPIVKVNKKAEILGQNALTSPDTFIELLFYFTNTSYKLSWLFVCFLVERADMCLWTKLEYASTFVSGAFWVFIK